MRSSSLDAPLAVSADWKPEPAVAADEIALRLAAPAAAFRRTTPVAPTTINRGFEEGLLGAMLEITNAEWYVLRLVSDEHQTLGVMQVSPAGVVVNPVLGGRANELPGSVEARAVVQRAPLAFDLGLEADGEPLRVMGPRSTGTVYPLRHNDILVGTLALGRPSGQFAFGALLEGIGRTLVDLIATQAAARQQRHEHVRARLLAQELEIARVIQRLLLPVALPQVPGYGLAGGWHPAREIGGDFYDAIALNEHTTLLFVADVMGKGIPAAIFATNLRSLLRGLSAVFDNPGQVLSRLNRLLYDELSAVEMFITAQVALVDTLKGTVTVVSAGHGPLLYAAGAGQPVEATAAQGVPLGVMEEPVYLPRQIPLTRAGLLFLHTDGLTDMRNAKGESYGMERLSEWLSANHVAGRSATELRGRLLAELKRFRGDAPMLDDQAFLLLAGATDDEEA
jgi:serine phosphatase RsbU (regulator of sigma subunit)